MSKTQTPQEITRLREAAGLSKHQAAERFGYSYDGWRKKESLGGSRRLLTDGEFELLQLLADEHSKYVLAQRKN